MKVGLFTVSSTLAKQDEIGKRVAMEVSSLLGEIRGDLKVSELITSANAAEDIVKGLRDEISGAIVAVATGGTERSIRAIASNLGKPILILANPFNNSLASSLEAHAILREQGLKAKLFYSPLDSSIIHSVKAFVQVCRAIQKLKDCRLGQVGGPSPWILTSKDEDYIKRRIGPELIRLEVAELLDLVKKVDPDEAEELAEKLKDKFGEVVDPSEDDILNAAKVYLAMRELTSKYDLSAITIRCFDLIEHDLTSCIGMSIFNDLGIVAGCEADLDAMLTMMIVSFLTDEPCWMANVVRVDKDANTVTLAHCTIATKMLADVKKSALRSHFESNKCASIQGPLRDVDVTIARLGGRELGKMTIASGKIVGSDMRDPDLCRTQVEIRLNGNVENFLENALGNHQILAYGNLTPLLTDFCQFKGIEHMII
jgi:L-fucose isomerase-like protein